MNKQTNYNKYGGLKHTFIISQFLGSLLRVSLGCSQGVGRVAFLLELGVLFRAHVTVGRTQFLVVMGLRATGLFLAVGLRLPPGPRGPQRLPAFWLSAQEAHIPAACFLKAGRRISHSGLLRWSLREWNMTVKMMSHHLYHILPVRSKSQVSPTFERRELHKSGPWGSPYGGSTTRSLPARLNFLFIPKEDHFIFVRISAPKYFLTASVKF